MRGGDKAPLRHKAKAKARRYAPLIKNVDESFSGTASCLTGFVNDFVASDRRSHAKGENVVVQCEPFGERGTHNRRGGSERLGPRSPGLGSHQQEIDQRDQGGSDTGSDQDVIGPEVATRRIEGGSG
jgi:hypothetical protein